MNGFICESSSELWENTNHSATTVKLIKQECEIRQFRKPSAHMLFLLRRCGWCAVYFRVTFSHIYLYVLPEFKQRNINCLYFFRNVQLDCISMFLSFKRFTETEIMQLRHSECISLWQRSEWKNNNTSILSLKTIQHFKGSCFISVVFQTNGNRGNSSGNI